MESPFNRSTLTPRSPPPTQAADTETLEQSAPPTEAVSTPDIQKWLSTIEQCLTEVCTISSEGGKLNTEQKLKIASNCRRVMGGISQMAVQYQSLKQKLISANSQIGYLNREQSITKQLHEIKNSIQTIPASSGPNLSFADMVKKSNNTFICPPRTASIAIYPEDKAKTSEETKKLVQNIIKPEEMKLRIRGLNKTKNGGVIISTESNEDLEKLKKSEHLTTSGLKFEETARKRPRIILLGVPSDISEKDVFEYLFDQNISEKYSSFERKKFLSSIKLSHKSGKKEASLCNYILEVTAEVRKMLISQERVYINWNSCPVRDYTLLTRCYKCHQYGHSAKYCRDSDPTCGHCGCVGHSINDCPAKAQPAKCATCLRYKKPQNHKTGDEQCPAKKMAENRYLRSVDYEDAGI